MPCPQRLYITIHQLFICPRWWTSSGCQKLQSRFQYCKTFFCLSNISSFLFWVSVWVWETFDFNKKKKGILHSTVNATLVLGKIVVGDQSTNTIIANIKNKLAISLPLKLLLQRQGTGQRIVAAFKVASQHGKKIDSVCYQSA